MILQAHKCGLLRVVTRKFTKVRTDQDGKSSMFGFPSPPEVSCRKWFVRLRETWSRFYWWDTFLNHGWTPMNTDSDETDQRDTKAQSRASLEPVSKRECGSGGQNGVLEFWSVRGAEWKEADWEAVIYRPKRLQSGKTNRLCSHNSTQVVDFPRLGRVRVFWGGLKNDNLSCDQPRRTMVRNSSMNKRDAGQSAVDTPPTFVTLGPSIFVANHQITAR